MARSKTIRRDSRGRELYTNEYQAANGSYVYSYRDLEGKRRSVSRWRLLPGDDCPINRFEGECLREAEERIRRSLARDVDPPKKDNLTVNDFWNRYLETKINISESTLVSLIYLYNRHIRDELGTKRINTIRYSHIKRFYVEKADMGMSVSSLMGMERILGSLFDIALRDGYISVNPCDGVLTEIRKRREWYRKEVAALTLKEQEALVDYLSRSSEFREYRPMVTVMLGTGLRAGEMLGLTWNNVDFEKNEISVDHTLHYGMTLEGKTAFYMTQPKTKASRRVIPMLPEVSNTLAEMYRRRGDFNAEYQVVVDGYTDFIFRDLDGRIYSDSRMNAALRRIQKRYNDEEREAAEREGREPLLLPKLHLHCLRHTFCTRLVEQGISVYTLKALMGHQYIETSVRVYGHISRSEIHKDMQAMAGKFRL